MDALAMQLLPGQIALNLSHVRIHDGDYVRRGSSQRPRLEVVEIAGVVQRLRDLKTVIVEDAKYRARHPADVVDRIILKIESAAAARSRAYPSPSG
jgi:hypothetical protein